MISHQEEAQDEAYKAAQYARRNLSYDLGYEQTVGDSTARAKIMEVMIANGGTPLSNQPKIVTEKCEIQIFWFSSSDKNAFLIFLYDRDTKIFRCLMDNDPNCPPMMRELAEKRLKTKQIEALTTHWFPPRINKKAV